jgi:P-type Ca2+ transporter type 2C
MASTAPETHALEPAQGSEAWFAKDEAAVVAALETDAAQGLTQAEAAARLARHGPNEITGEKPPSVWRIAIEQLREPMNIMLIAVTAVSFAIGEVPTGIIVALLIALNVVLGSRQELKARASVDALSRMQVPQTRVVRSGHIVQVPARDVVAGDIVEVEAGEIAPADGRIIRSATLETQEAALTGESAPVAKDAAVLPTPDVILGDRTDMLFQNTSVTRGTGAMIVTATGMDTEMGRIATMLTSVSRVRSPLQRELDSLTKVLGIIAWSAVAFIVVVGLIRGLAFDDVVLLGTAMAISAIPTGMPAFVSGLLSLGAKQLAEARAVVKNLTDVETLGATSAINTDKTGTLTMNEMMVSTIYAGGSWFKVTGEGYAKTGTIESVAGVPVPDFSRLALGLALDTDATVSDDGAVIGDPTEAALVVLAAKLGVDAEETRRAYPRLAEVPFDSAYKFMATFHRVTVDGAEHVIELVKGGPDVVFARCSHAGGPLSGSQGPIAEVQADVDAANARMGEKGLRVLAFAARLVADDELDAMARDPMSLTQDLAFVGMAGMIDPLRAEAKDAVTTALSAGIDVRMITGDNPITANAIGASLGLGPGAISGAEFQALSDEEIVARLPQLHVLGRVTPEDKLRLARLMQGEGQIVAATGDAVNDAVALKQADIGVAMGSGSEVTKQAARMILTDDRQLRNLGARGPARAQGLRQGRRLRPLPDDPAAGAGDAVHRCHGVRHQRRRRSHAADGAVSAALRDRGRRRGHRRRSRRPERHEPATARPEAPDRQPGGDHLVGHLRGRALRRRAPAARHRPGRPEGRRAERLDVDDLRRHGARHGAQRAHQPPRAGQRARPADPQSARDLARAGAHGRARHRAPRPRAGAAHRIAQRASVVRVPRPRDAPAAGHRGAQVAPAPPRPTCGGPRRPPGGRPGPCGSPMSTRETMLGRFLVNPGEAARIADRDPASPDDPELADLAQDELAERAKDAITRGIAELSEAQELLWATDRYALLVVLQAMDAAGKDSVIKHVMSGVNPQGVQVVSFRQPSSEELDHDFLWRIAKALPERGRIGIFNRSHYEEVVALKVHPEWLEPQRLPPGERGEKFWQERYEDINAFERHLDRNGTKVVKFFLNVSREAQKKRFLARLDVPGKEWKIAGPEPARRLGR